MSGPTVPYSFYGGNRDAILCRDPEIVLAGPAECLAGETGVFIPSLGYEVPIMELYQAGNPCEVLTVFGPAMAEPPFVKGYDRLYRVTSNSGKSFLATGKHVVMTSRGWTYVSDLAVGDSLPEFVGDLPQSSLGPCLLSSLQGACHWLHTTASCQANCFPCYHLCGGQPRRAVVGDLAFSPLPSDAHVHNHGCLLGDGLAFSEEHSQSCLSFFRPSNANCFPLFGHGQGGQPRIYQGIPLPDGDLCPPFWQFQSRNSLPGQAGQLSQSYDSMPSLYIQSTQFPVVSDNGEPSDSEFQADRQLFLRSLFHQKPARLTLSDSMLSAYNLLPYYPPKSYYTIQWRQLSSVEFEREDVYYDMHVPGAGHYIANGFLHHNTGKTLAWLWKLHTLAYKYPGCQLAIIRKRKTDITSTVYHTLKRDLLADYGPGTRVYGGEHPQWIDYPGGARIWIGGMDDPGKTLSAERDLIYWNQAEEGSLSDWEYLTRAVTGRGAVMPYTQLVGDCNPSTPSHWIRQRALAANGSAPALRLFESTHRDNPTLWDHVQGEWTEQGRRSLERLSRMTGNRKQRLYHGLWVAPEGAIYDVFDGVHTDGSYGRHVVKAFPIPQAWPRAVGIDPFGAQIAAVWLAFDPNTGVLNVYREYMEPFGATVAGHAAAMLEESKGEPIFAWVCGQPAERAWRVEFQAAGIPAIEPPIADLWVGIERVYRLLNDFGLVVHDTCPGLISEIGDYRRKMNKATGEATEVIENKDVFHGIDSLRYVIAYLTEPLDESQVWAPWQRIRG